MLDRVSALLVAVGIELREKRDASGGRGMPLPAAFGADADCLAHDMLVRGLSALIPGLPVISEEDRSSQSAARPARYWLIDPVDGTASYCGGFSGYVTQVALMEFGQPQLSAIYAPATEELFAAVRASGAWRNGIGLRVDPAPVQRRLIDNYPEPRGTSAVLMAQLRCDGYVESGSLGLKICRIADGTAELFFKDIVLRDWDIAPAALVLEEAGGTLTALAGTPFIYDGDFEKIGVIAAANRFLAWEVANALREIAA